MVTSFAGAAGSRRSFRGLRFGLAAVAICAAMGTGCKSSLSDPFLARQQRETEDDDASPEDSEHRAADDTPGDKSGNTAAAERAAEGEASAGEASAHSIAAEKLGSDSWYEKVPPPFVERPATQLRWQHSQLDSLLTLRVQQRPDLAQFDADENLVVRANAAILQAHWGQGQPTANLVAAIRNPALKQTLRCAAVEALARVEEPSPAAALRELLPQVAGATLDGLPNPERTTIFDLQADMTRALARHYEAGDEVWFTAAIRSQEWHVRLEGIIAWTAVTGLELPPVAVDLRNDPDPRLRCQALRAIAAHRDRHAIEYLQQALSDRVIEVHMAAIESLGKLDSDDARALLGKLKSEKSELVRAASITAMAVAGLQGEVEAAVKDKSQLVRGAVARSLSAAAADGQAVADRSVATAQDLVLDATNEVQRQSVASLESWPLETAGPVLLLAMSEGGYTARKEAAKQLARRWPPAIDFPVDAAPERRAAAWTALKQQWTKEYSDQVAAAKDRFDQQLSLSQARLTEIQEALELLSRVDVPAAAQKTAVASLSAIGPELIVALEQRADSSVPLPPVIYEEVLPAISPVFDVLRRTASTDLMQRRAAASELIAQTADAVLSPLALDRLTRLVETERDPVVWRTVLMALANDPRDKAVHLAYVGIGSTSVDVRRRACENLALHGSPQNIQVLLPALEDPDGTVVLAAIRALGATGTLEDPAPLVRFLHAPDKRLRYEAALSLARLQSEQGLAGLERLAQDDELEVRIRAARAMGEIRDRSFVPTLMSLLSDRHDVQRVAMISLASIAGEDVAADVGGVPLASEEKVRRWQQWQREQLTAPE